MANIAGFSLAATGQTPWFILLGRGQLRGEVPGTWTGTVGLQMQRPDGTAADVRDMGGDAIAFTANQGVFDIEGVGPYRYSFTRSTGTATPKVWSDESAIYFPNADAVGGGLTFDQLPTAWPVLPASLAECRTYINDPTAWTF